MLGDLGECRRIADPDASAQVFRLLAELGEAGLFSRACGPRRKAERRDGGQLGELRSQAGSALSADRRPPAGLSPL
jgi:hypothetical protein